MQSQLQLVLLLCAKVCAVRQEYRVQQKILWREITSRKWVVSKFRCRRFCRQEILLLSSVMGQSNRISAVKHVSWLMLSPTCMRCSNVTFTYNAHVRAPPEANGFTVHSSARPLDELSMNFTCLAACSSRHININKQD